MAMDYSDCVESIPEVLVTEEMARNPSLNTMLNSRDRPISAMDRIKFLFSRIVQANAIQLRTINAAEEIGLTNEDLSNAGLKTFLSILPDPCKIYDCSQ
jgi:hypothetical protein